MKRVGLLLLTHGDIGKSLLAEARKILGERLDDFRLLANHGDSLLAVLPGAIDEADRGAGVLILTDLVGASPANQAHGAANGRQCAVVTGVNLPMLIRVWNYRDGTLEQLADCALEGGRRGVEVLL